MLQNWASEGDFYTSGFVLSNVIEPVTFECCTFYICIALEEISHLVDIYIDTTYI